MVPLLLVLALFFVAATLASLYLAGPAALVLAAAGVLVAAGRVGVLSGAPGAALLALATVALLTAYMERRARPPGGDPGRLATTVAGQLGALAASTMLFGPATGMGLFAATFGRLFPYRLADCSGYLWHRTAARLLRLLVVVLVAGITVATVV